jgi:hypothetical protein
MAGIRTRISGSWRSNACCHELTPLLPGLSEALIQGPGAPAIGRDVRDGRMNRGHNKKLISECILPMARAASK